MDDVRIPSNIVPLPLEKRDGRVPRHGYASIRPATRWQDALICGNGTVEVKIFGDPGHEILLFRHEGMLEPELPPGRKHPPKPPEIAWALPRVREFLLRGEYGKANDFAFDAIRKAGYPDRVGNNRRCEGFALILDMETEGKARDYLRSVDFRTGEAVVSFEDGHGRWVRRTMVSRPAQAAVSHIQVPDGYDGALTLRIVKPSEAVPDGTEENSSRRPVNDPGMEYRFEYRSDGIIVEGRSNVESIPDAGFRAVIRVVTGSEVGTEAGRLLIRGGREITILTTVEWRIDYVRTASETAAKLEALLGRAGTDYLRLLEDHANRQSELFDRASLELASGRDLLLSTEELLVQEHLSEGFSPALVEKVFDMGRYFLLYSHGSVPYVWGHVNINVNLQVASGVQTALPEMMEVYFAWIESLLDEWRENARSIFGFRGLLSSVHPDGLNGVLFHMTPMSPHHYWVAGAGWCYQPFWEHYQVTGDIDFARKRIFPALREIAMFFQDYLTLRDSAGRYVFAPSYSPENWPGNLDQSRCVVINSVMDISVCREVLTHLLELCDTLGIDEPEIPRWKEILDGMPLYLTDDLGALKEWAWPDLPERFDHRHLSHLYGVWPGDEIREDIDPDLARAALLANRKRAQGNASIHGIMHRALAAARLRDPFLAGRNLKQVLDQGYLNPGSMMTNHNPYRIYCPDACGSLPVLLVEMLLYSRPGIIELLPAVPAGLGRGVLRGIRARTRVIVEELRWDLTSGSVEIELLSLADQRLEIRPPAGWNMETVDVELASGERWERRFRIGLRGRT